jgi:hypothetical protein
MGKRRGGTHATRVRIFEDGDPLALKFWKLLAHKHKQGGSHLHNWFFAMEQHIDHVERMPRKAFAELIHKFDYHIVHAQTKSGIPGKQLTSEQLQILTRMIVREGPTLSYDEVASFASGETSGNVPERYEEEKAKLHAAHEIKNKLKQGRASEKPTKKTRKEMMEQKKMDKVEDLKQEAKLQKSLNNARVLGPILRFLFEHCLPDCTSEWRVSEVDAIHSVDANATAFLSESVPVQQVSTVSTMSIVSTVSAVYNEYSMCLYSEYSEYSEYSKYSA